MSVKPLRKVMVHESHGRHLLECRHRLPIKMSAYGPSYPARARCLACAEGWPVDVSDDELNQALKKVRP